MPDPDTLRDVQPAPFPPPGFDPILDADGKVIGLKPKPKADD